MNLTMEDCMSITGGMFSAIWKKGEDPVENGERRIATKKLREACRNIKGAAKRITDTIEQVTTQQSETNEEKKSLLAEIFGEFREEVMGYANSAQPFTAHPGVNKAVLDMGMAKDKALRGFVESIPPEMRVAEMMVYIK